MLCYVQPEGVLHSLFGDWLNVICHSTYQTTVEVDKCAYNHINKNFQE